MISRTIAVVALLAPLAPVVANAAEGGGNNCPWAQDLKLDFGRKSITVPQSLFDGKTQDAVIDGYQLTPDIRALSLRIVGPRGETWQAALTLLAGGKRCTAFYVGRPEPMEPNGDAASVAIR